MLSASTEEERALAAAAGAVSAAVEASSSGTDGRSAKRARASADPAQHNAKRLRVPELVLDGKQEDLLKDVHFATLGDDLDQMLHSVRPGYVILYDIQLSCIRQLEVYQSLYPGQPLKVLFSTAGSLLLPSRSAALPRGPVAHTRCPWRICRCSC